MNKKRIISNLSKVMGGILIFSTIQTSFVYATENNNDSDQASKQIEDVTLVENNTGIVEKENSNNIINVNLSVNKEDNLSTDLPDSVEENQVIDGVSAICNTTYTNSFVGKIDKSQLKIISSDESIIQVKDNKLYPLKVGTCDIYVEYREIKISKTITVNPEVKKVQATSLTFDSKYIKVNTNEALDLSSINLNAKYNDESEEKISLADCNIEESKDYLVSDGKIYIKNVGVTKVNISKDDVKAEIMFVSKNAEDKEYVLYTQNFDSVEENTLPEGFSTLNNISTVTAENAVYVSEGSLILDGTSNNYTPSGISLPDYLNDFSDYNFSADVTILNANNNSRWFSLMYRIQEDPYMYYQMAIRQNATASNGVEFAQRTQVNNWNVMLNKSFSEAIDTNKMYKVNVKTNGNRIQESINDEILIDSKNATDYSIGGLGFQSAGCKIKIDNIKVILQEDELEDKKSNYTDVQDYSKNISVAPTSIVNINKAEDINLGNYTSLPANMSAKVNANLDIIDNNNQKIITLDEFINAVNNKLIPIIEVEDNEAVNKIIQYINDKKIKDISILSENPDIVKKIRTQIPSARGILKFNDTEALSNNRMMEMVKITNSSKAKVALIPSKLITNDVAEYIQKRLITVWTNLEDESNYTLHKCINAGVNGIITNNVDKLYNAYSIYDQDTLIREPLIIGHRGTPALAPENTIESCKLAVENGANVVENDIYLTKDNQIVIMHDDSINRTTNGTGNVEDYTLEELRQFNANVQFPDKYPDVKIPTLNEYFDTFKNTDVSIFIEIKTTNPNIIEPLKNLIEQYNVEDQVVLISFSGDQIDRAREAMPWVSIGYLNGLNTTSDDPGSSMESIANLIQDDNATFNPSYNCVNKEVLDELANRGITAWPWTYNNYDVFVNHFKLGVYGLTTNYSYWAKDLICDVLPDNTEYKLTNDNRQIELTAKGNTYGRETKELGVEIVPIENEDIISIEGSNVTALKDGTAIVMLKTKVKIDDNNSYYLYSEPIKIKVDMNNTEAGGSTEPGGSTDEKKDNNDKGTTINTGDKSKIGLSIIGLIAAAFGIIKKKNE